MTNKNDSTKPTQVRIDQQKLNAAKITIRPGVYEVGKLDDGSVIIKTVIGTQQGRVVAATERRTD